MRRLVLRKRVLIIVVENRDFAGRARWCCFESSCLGGLQSISYWGPVPIARRLVRVAVLPSNRSVKAFTKRLGRNNLRRSIAI